MFIQALFRKADVELLFVRPIHVQQLVAKNRVLVKHFVKLAQLEQADLVEHFRFDLPVLLHRGRQRSKVTWWHITRGWIVIRVTNQSLFLVSQVSRLQKFRQSIFWLPLFAWLLARRV